MLSKIRCRFFQFLAVVFNADYELSNSRAESPSFYSSTVFPPISVQSRLFPVFQLSMSFYRVFRLRRARNKNKNGETNGFTTFSP
jgi:hypothetical protein